MKEKSFFTILLSTAALILALYFVTTFQTTTANSRLEAEKYIVNEIKKCNGQKFKNPCYKIIAKNFLNQYPLELVMGIFKKNERSADFYKSCHTISHYLGQEEFKRLKSIKAVILESSPDECLGGTIHGAVEGFFMEKKITDYENNPLIQSAIPEACGDKNSYDNLVEYQTCIHGLGHALMFVTESDLVKALKLCDYLPIESEEVYCYTGSLMQNSSDAFSREHPAKYYSASDPLYPCNILEKKYQKTCYGYGALGRFQLDPPKSIETCFRIPEEYRHYCFQTYGIDRVTVRQTEQEVKKDCDLVELDMYKVDCYNSAAFDLVVKYGLESTLGYDFCKELDTEFKHSCYKQLGNGANRFTKNKDVVKKYCDDVLEKEYRTACLNSQ